MKKLRDKQVQSRYLNLRERTRRKELLQRHPTQIPIKGMLPTLNTPTGEENQYRDELCTDTGA